MQRQVTGQLQFVEMQPPAVFLIQGSATVRTIPVSSESPAEDVLDNIRSALLSSEQSEFNNHILKQQQ